MRDAEWHLRRFDGRLRGHATGPEGRDLTVLDRGRVVLLAGGTGHPYFTTDTAASLRAIEIGADLLLKATKVDGVFSADPVKDPDAKRYSSLSFEKVLRDNLAVMDATAVVMCRDNELPMRVFNIHNKGDLLRIMHGEDIGTLVTADAPEAA